MDKVNQKRSIEIDLVRGLAIILMVIGHTETAAQNFIYLFHMAVFFMASGYLYPESAADSVTSVKQYVLRKIKRLWVPYAVWTAIFSILRNVFIDWNIYTTNPMILSEVESRYAVLTPYWTREEIILNIMKGCVLPGNVQVGGALWFFATLLQITVLYVVIDYILRRMLQRDRIMIAQGIVSLGFLLIGYWCSSKGIFLFGTVRAFSFYCLYYLGYIFEKYKVRHLEDTIIKSSLVMAGSFLLLLVCNPLGEIALGENEWTNPIFLLATSISGWLLLYEGAGILKKVPFLCKMITYIGANTVPIVILHLLAFKIVSYIGVSINGQNWYLVAAFPVLYRDGLWWMAYAVVGIVVPLLLGWLYNKIKRYLRGMYGNH